MSTNLLKLIHEKGNIACSLRYFDYLTLRCKVKDKKIHTELGFQYIQNIINLLKRFPKLSEADSQTSKKAISDKNLDIIYDLNEAKKNKSMIELRNKLRIFLSNSLYYEPKSIFKYMEPYSSFLNKEHAIMLMKLNQYSQCFNVCIDVIGEH